MVRTDPGALSDTTVAWIDRRGNPPWDRWLGVECVVNSPPGRDPALLLKQEGAQCSAWI